MSLSGTTKPADTAHSKSNPNRIAFQTIADNVGLGGAKYNLNSQEFTPFLNRTFALRASFATTFQQKPKKTYVPLQTREHAWAGISGIASVIRGWRGIYVPRR